MQGFHGSRGRASVDHVINHVIAISRFDGEIRDSCSDISGPKVDPPGSTPWPGSNVRNAEPSAYLDPL